MGSQPWPRLLEVPAFEVAAFTAFDCPGEKEGAAESSRQLEAEMLAQLQVT